VDWKKDHDRRVATFPEDVREAHKHSANHRSEINQSQSCGCFHCGAIFSPDQIEDWVDEVDGEGQTALCPECGIDSVIGDPSGFAVSRGFLERMRLHWFNS
jgi:hypothetical protein